MDTAGELVPGPVLPVRSAARGHRHRTDPAAPGFALGVALVTAVLAFCVQLGIGWRGAAGWSGRRRLGVLLALGCLTYLPLAAGAAWPCMGGFLAGSILMLCPARTSWILFSGVIASMLAAPLALGLGARDAVYLMIASLSSGLTVFALYQLRRAARHAQGAGRGARAARDQRANASASPGICTTSSGTACPRSR